MLTLRFFKARYRCNFGLFMIFFLLAPAVASAQDRNPWDQYEAEKKQPNRAAVYEFFVPFWGNAYAGNWRKSLAPFAIDIAGWAWIIYTSSLMYEYVSPCDGLSGVDLIWCDSPPNDNPKYVRLREYGIAAVMFGALLRSVIATTTAKTFNGNLKERLGIALSDLDLNIGPAPGGVSFGVSIPLGR